MIHVSIQIVTSVLLQFCDYVKTRENELRERIPVPHDNFFKSI